MQEAHRGAVLDYSLDGTVHRAGPYRTGEVMQHFDALDNCDGITDAHLVREEVEL